MNYWTVFLLFKGSSFTPWPSEVSVYMGVCIYGCIYVCIYIYIYIYTVYIYITYIHTHTPISLHLWKTLVACNFENNVSHVGPQPNLYLLVNVCAARSMKVPFGATFSGWVPHVQLVSENRLFMEWSKKVCLLWKQYLGGCGFNNLRGECCVQRVLGQGSHLDFCLQDVRRLFSLLRLG